MSKATTIHNAMSYALVVDAVGHIVGGGETAEIEIDTVTHRLIDNGSIIIMTQPEDSKKTRASRRSDVDEKNGD
jgi:hypothetical protein